MPRDISMYDFYMNPLIEKHGKPLVYMTSNTFRQARLGLRFDPWDAGPLTEADMTMTRDYLRTMDEVNAYGEKRN